MAIARTTLAELEARMHKSLADLENLEVDLIDHRDALNRGHESYEDLLDQTSKLLNNVQAAISELSTKITP